MNEKEPIIESGKCSITIDKEGNINMKNCDTIKLGTSDIDMLKKVKDIVIEEDDHEA